MFVDSWMDDLGVDVVWALYNEQGDFFVLNQDYCDLSNAFPLLSLTHALMLYCDRRRTHGVFRWEHTRFFGVIHFILQIFLTRVTATDR